MSKFDFSKIQAQEVSGLDAFLAREPEVITPTKTARVKLASLADLKGFTRLSAETLIRRSEKDLWSISKEADGSLVIERMFDDKKPLSG